MRVPTLAFCLLLIAPAFAGDGHQRAVEMRTVARKLMADGLSSETPGPYYRKAMRKLHAAVELVEAELETAASEDQRAALESEIVTLNSAIFWCGKMTPLDPDPVKRPKKAPPPAKSR